MRREDYRKSGCSENMIKSKIRQIQLVRDAAAEL